MDAIVLVLGIAIGVVVGFLIATLALKKATPQQLWDKFMWALERAKGIPALQTVYDQLAKDKADELVKWSQEQWNK